MGAPGTRTSFLGEIYSRTIMRLFQRCAAARSPEHPGAPDFTEMKNVIRDTCGMTVGVFFGAPVKAPHRARQLTNRALTRRAGQIMTLAALLAACLMIGASLADEHEHKVRRARAWRRCVMHCSTMRARRWCCG